VTLVLVATAASACSQGQTTQSQPTTTTPRFSGFHIPSILPSNILSGAPPCRFPVMLPTPSWLPADLPLPAGMYQSEEKPNSFGYHQAIFVVPGQLAELARFVLSEWPKAGWVLGRGDAEANEIEDQFSKSPATGAFKAQGQFCVPGYSLMLLIFTPDVTKIRSTPPGTGGGSPIPTASPSPTPSS
jgi:hypothetical protein